MFSVKHIKFIHSGQKPINLEPEIINQLNCGIMLLDQNYRIQYWNQWLSRHTELSCTQAAGLKLLDLFPQLAHSQFCQAVEDCFRHQRHSFFSHQQLPAFFPLYQNNGQALIHAITIKPLAKAAMYCCIEIQPVEQLQNYERLARQQRHEAQILTTALIESQSLSHATFDLSFDSLIIIDNQGRLLDCNPVATALFFQYKDPRKFTPIQSLLLKPGNQTINIKTDLSQRICAAPFIGVDKNQQQFPALVSASRINNSAYLITIHKQTLQLEIENQLACEKSQTELTLNSITDAVLLSNHQGQLTFMNSAAQQITAWSQANALGQNIDTVIDLHTTDDRALHISSYDPGHPGTRYSKPGFHQAVLKRRDKIRIKIEFAITRMHSETDMHAGLIIVLHDLTARSQAAQKVAWQASHDQLTCLLNRSEFEQRITQLQHNSKHKKSQHGLLHLDLDQFKIINDLCGHIAGDDLLCQLTDHINKQLPAQALLARLGGDAFGILLIKHMPEQTRQVAENIHQQVKKFRFHWTEQVFSLTVSIGLLNINAESDNANNLLSLADTACFFAKENGRNRTYAIENNNQALANRRNDMQWINKLRQAIDHNTIMLFGQAITPLLNGSSLRPRIEILTRLIDDNQLISPDRFVEAAENYDLMPTIDRAIIRKIFSVLSIMKASERLLININLSAKTINDEYFLDFLIKEIRKSAISPRALCFEITETAAIANLNQAAEFIRRVQNLGCEFALDDFGSGLSSISYLTSLPVNYLKIDGSFVRNIAKQEHDFEMLKVINQLGKVMGVKTIAEYVESEQITEKLIEIGVDYGQGYAIAKPEPLNNLLIRNNAGKL